MQCKLNLTKTLKVLLLGLLVNHTVNALAQTLQVDVSSILNTRLVTTYTDNKLVTWKKGVDGSWSGLATSAAATAMNSKAKAFPNDGLFPKNSEHPEVLLNFNDTDGVNNQVRLSEAADTYSFDVVPNIYSRLDIFCMSGNGLSNLSIELVYATGSEIRKVVVPDWYNAIPATDLYRYNLAIDLGKWSNVNKEMEFSHHFLHGIKLNPNINKTLQKVIITKSKAGTLSFWGATAVIYHVDTTFVNNAIIKALNISESITEGISDGQYMFGAKKAISNAIDSANSLLALARIDAISQKKLDSVVFIINDSCSKAESMYINSGNILTDKHATRYTINLYNNLKSINGKYFLFGQHDAISYGIGWTDNGTGSRSDVKSVSGSHPAIHSWDVNNIVEQSGGAQIANWAQIIYRQGGIITLCWHQNNISGGDSWTLNKIVSSMLPADSTHPAGANYYKYRAKLDKLAEFARNLKGDSGEAIPIIFRPYHEHNGSWFWWGKGYCTSAEYIALWRYTVNYLRDSANVHNFIYAFSPDGGQFTNKADYLYNYPGDDYVDVYGLDFYFGEGTSTEVNKFKSKLEFISEYATERNKLAALTEAGDRLYWEKNNAPDALKIPNWYTRCFLEPLRLNETTQKVAYAAVWRNGSTVHHFAPYPGHEAVPDFLNFYDDTSSLFLNDIQGFYLDTNSTGFTKASQACRIKTFSLSDQKGDVPIWIPATKYFTLNVTVPDSISLLELIPSFSISENATLKVNNSKLESGVKPFNFSNEIQFTVIAQNGKDSSVYKVKAVRPIVSKVNNSKAKVFSCYPNPTHANLEVNSTEKITSIEVYNLLGIKVIHSNINCNKYTLNVESLPIGNYCLIANSLDGKTQRSLFSKL